MGLMRRGLIRAAWWWQVPIFAVLLWTPSASGATPSFLCNRFELEWRATNPDLPPLGPLRNTPVSLDRTARGYTVARGDHPGVRTNLRSLNAQRSVRIDAAALDAMASAIRGALEMDGLLGVTVDVAMQQESSGTQPVFTAWLIADIPFPDLTPNPVIPRDLASMEAVAAGDITVDNISLTWTGDVSHLPSSDDFLDAIRVPVQVQAGAVVVDSSGQAELGRLRLDHDLRWTPQAIEALTSAVTTASRRLGADVTATVSSDMQQASDGATIAYTIHVSQVGARDETSSATAIPPPPAMTPATTPVKAPAAAEAAPRTLTQRPVLAPQVEGVRVRWAGDAAMGRPEAIFRTTWARLRLVEDDVEAGWGDLGELTTFESLQTFPRRGWTASATRAVLAAARSRLDELGMSAITLSDAIVEENGQQLVIITMHPPARSVDLPPSADTDATIDGTAYYAVWPFEVAYQVGHSDLPSAGSFAHLELTLGRNDTGWTRAVGDGTDVSTTLSQLNLGGAMRYDADAIREIGAAIAAYLIDQDLMGVGVQPLATQIPTAGPDAGADLRQGGTELTLVVTISRVGEVRTIARGDRVDDTTSENHPEHEHIAEGSPVQAAEGEEGEGTLLRRGQMDDYLHRISRHPGRDVEVSVAASSNLGDVNVDYIVTEAKPWTAWFQYGNTGTKNEGYQRYRAGFWTSQLTGNDDIFSIQYGTSNLHDTNMVIGSYEAPLSEDGRLRWGADGSWSQYFADEFGVGPTPFSDAFTGFSWSGGGKLIWNIHQDGPLFVDLVGGARLQHLGVNNRVILLNEVSEQASFVIPYGMLQMDRLGEWSNAQLSVGVDGNVLSHDEETLLRLGLASNSPNVADTWVRLNWYGSFSTYLEPLLNGDAWNDPSTPESSTLMHELAFVTSGQYSFGSRLLPPFQSVAGGPGTNRGYPVSVAAGDNAVNITGEYRFHVPQMFGIQSEPGTLFGQPFRHAPQHVYGRADWDLSLLGFVDWSWLTQNDKQFYEFDQTLLSAGIGLDFRLKQNFRVRLDWGWALRALEGGLYDSGNNRLYVQTSLSF